jgi:hypothetical protein
MAGDKNISVDDAETTLVENAAGIVSPVARIQPEDGQQIVVQGGEPLRLSLNDDSDADLPNNSKVFFAKVAADSPADYGRPISNAIIIRPFNDLSLSEQLDEAEDARRLTFLPREAGRPTGTVTIDDDEELILVLDSTTAVDKADTYFSYPADRI